MLSEVRVEVGLDRPLSTGCACVKEGSGGQPDSNPRLGEVGHHGTNVWHCCCDDRRISRGHLRSFESQALNVVLRLENLSK